MLCMIRVHIRVFNVNIIIILIIKKNDGVCYCSKKCNKKGRGKGDNQCMELSFMIFRTGSVLIVGHCHRICPYEEYIIFIKKYS